MRIIPFKLPLSYLLMGSVCLTVGIVSTHWYYQGKLSETAENLTSTKQRARTCNIQLASTEETLQTCNKAHYLNGYCMHSLETCEADTLMLVEEARRLYAVVEELLLADKAPEDTPTHP